MTMTVIYLLVFTITTILQPNQTPETAVDQMYRSAGEVFVLIGAMYKGWTEFREILKEGFVGHFSGWVLSVCFMKFTLRQIRIYVPWELSQLHILQLHLSEHVPTICTDSRRRNGSGNSCSQWMGLHSLLYPWLQADRSLCGQCLFSYSFFQFVSFNNVAGHDLQDVCGRCASIHYDLCGFPSWIFSRSLLCCQPTNWYLSQHSLFSSMNQVWWTLEPDWKSPSSSHLATLTSIITSIPSFQRYQWSSLWFMWLLLASCCWICWLVNDACEMLI